ncbi:Uncharacterized protein C32A11.02c [Erysiphe neolycopersici]|uniref:Uncharacterized protein C32A11.02c n=1 Tax=Erysiphe neolycopersici TaxID=212602 RepID=A0A420HPE6_9PEZI|nr:Uncharacterized protein C32A11.02c [Erysiphe neolycopersici]
MSPAEVNQPMDETTKEKDVDRKLQLYGVASALQAGKVPSNEQIDIALNSFLASSALSNPPPELSVEGQGLIADVREVIEQAKILLLSKNQGDVIQDFIWQSQQIKKENLIIPGAPVGAESAKKHSQQALDGLRTLGTLIISNGQFRKLLKDASILIREIVGDTAQKFAEYASPSEGELSQIDNPASQNTWYEGTNISGQSLKDRVKYFMPNLQSKERLQETSSTSQAFHSDDSRNPYEAAIRSTQEYQMGPQSSPSQQSFNQEYNSPAREKVSGKLPEGSIKQVSENREQAMSYLSGKLSDDRRERTKFRLKKLVSECQENHDYQEAITTLLNLAETYVSYANKIGHQVNASLSNIHNDNALNQAEADLKILIERFANGTSTKALFANIDAIYSDANHDLELKNWLKQINSYIRKCFKKQGYIMNDESVNEWNEIFDTGDFLLKDRYRNRADQFLSEIKFLAEQFDHDPLNKRFAQATEKLFSDLGHDENGNPSFKPQLLKDLTEIIIPTLFENIRYIPIPRIEYSDEIVDLVVENLIIESDNFFPNIFELANDNYIRLGRKSVSNKSRHSAFLHIAGIQMDIKDVAFYLKKKKGFPSIQDTGIVDIFLGGSGFSFTMNLSTSDSKDQENFFKIENVDVNIKNFKIKIKKSQHKLLLAIAKPILLKIIRPALQKALELNILENARKLDSLLFQIKLKADRAMQEAKNHPEESKNIYQHYLTAFQKYFFEKKEKAEAVSSGVTVNLAITKSDSIFPDINLPEGISSIATKYKELALQGEKWESAVFNLGTAAPSKNIPIAPEVDYKEHPSTIIQGNVS